MFITSEPKYLTHKSITFYVFQFPPKSFDIKSLAIPSISDLESGILSGVCLRERDRETCIHDRHFMRNLSSPLLYRVKYPQS